MKTKTITLASAALASAMLTHAAQAEDYPTVNLKYALYFSESIPQAQVLKWWAAELEDRSGGAITVDFFWSESLGKSTELLELVGQGAVELASPAPSYYASKLPLMNVTYLPMIFPDNGVARATSEAVAALPTVVAEHDRNNVVPILWTSLPTYHILCTKPIAT
ncbi:MAG: hypothetical protein AAGH17_01100, partial [Pseudomonadota bacterium]